MDVVHPHFTARTSFSFLLLILLQTSAEATNICSGPSAVEFAENNTVGAVVATITVQPGVTLELLPPSDTPNNPFRLIENQLIATSVLDYETEKSHVAKITCHDLATSLKLNISIVIIVVDKNDNPPVFNQNPYLISVNEMSPVGATVGIFPATDLDEHYELYYTLTSDSNHFKLKSPTIPEVLIQTSLDYDKVKNVQLVLCAQDTQLKTTATRASFTATTTIMVTILDGDNRPPWFQPCAMHEVGGAVICQNAGYNGTVTLNEQETGVLPLKPGPLYAIDGDSGINEEIMYSFLSGNDDRLFDINANTGNISMLRPADVLETIHLTVLASQKRNTYQFATTTVAISILVKSLHPPQFQRPRYEGIITTVGSMAMDKKNKDEALLILATDGDYTATGHLNPDITYSIKGSSDFSIINGHLFMTKAVPDATLSLQVVAQDTSNGESDTAQLIVEVTSVIIPSGGYGPADMAALGVTLGILLLICLVVIGVLVHRMRKGKADWRKIYEASVFRSSLGKGSGGPKDGIQYTNEAFENDEDEGGMGSGGPKGGNVMAAGEPQKAVEDIPFREAIVKSLAPLHTLLPDDASQVSFDKVDNEKEVKPILTKERRVEDGYKAVWFKEDIDPNAKEEVVIIPDSREDHSEEEDEEQSSSNRKNDNSLIKTPKVVFADADLDSGLGLKMGDPAEDSDDDEALTCDL